MSAPGPAGTARTGRATTTVTPLPASGPGVGDTLLIERATWTVTSHATYRSEGYHADEWECAKLGTTAYLLKETEGDGVRWFFTISVPAPAVTLPDGTALAPSITRAPEASPPSALHFRGGVYRYETTTDGSYEEAPGRGVAKTTWEYWDAAHAHNLAIERWPAGRIEAYHGA